MWAARLTSDAAVRGRAIVAAAAICELAVCFPAQAQLPMPDFVKEGATYEQASERLRLKYHRTPAPPQFGPSDLPAGRIFGQQPPAGTDLREGDPIVLQVADGTAPPQITNNIHAPSFADVSVTVGLQTTGPFTPGANLHFLILVTNAGPSTATHLQVVAAAPNLAVTDVSGACAALPCEIASLEANFTATINAVVTINAAGPFEMALTATAAESDPDRANNVATSGTFTASAQDTVLGKPKPQRVTPPTDAPVPTTAKPSMPSRQRLDTAQKVPLLQWLVVFVAVLASVAGTVVTARKASWRRMVNVDAALDQSGTSAVGPLTLDPPPIGLKVLLEPGHAAPIGPVPVIRTEV